MPFQDTDKGKTHSYNDGCGEPAHNKLYGDFKIPTLPLSNPVGEEDVWFEEQLKKARADERAKILNELEKADWPTEMMSHNKYDVIVRCKETVKRILLNTKK